MAADAFLAGVFLAVCYDVLRIFRNIADHSTFWIGAEDILYWCASGALLYHAGPSMILVKYISAILRKIGSFLEFIGRPIRICRKRLKFWIDRVKISLCKQKSIQRIRKRWNEKYKKKKVTKQNRND